tara:strand:- start:298 stop:486 length:189 start_codon:yes stop_codon:yes gene_type:complete
VPEQPQGWSEDAMTPLRRRMIEDALSKNSAELLRSLEARVARDHLTAALGNDGLLPSEPPQT